MPTPGGAMAQTTTDGAMAASPTERPVPPRRKRASRTSPQLLVALLAGLLAVVGFLFATGGTKGTPVAVAARDIAAGEPVTAADVRLVDMVVPAELADRVLRPADANAPTPRVATHAIVAGSLLQRTDLVEPGGPSTQRAMSIPIDPTRAVNGTLRVGDVVDVVDASGTDGAYVLTGARVVAVADTGGGRLGGSSRDYAVTVAVDAASALRLAAAIVADKLSIVRSTGAPPIAVTPPTTGVRR